MGFEPGAEGWKAQTNPLSYGCTPKSQSYKFTLKLTILGSSFDESARYDFPTTIDYILNESGHEQIFFVGYSMATTQYLILLSELPEYNDKIRAGFLLGPTAFGGNATNPLIPLSSHAETIQEPILWNLFAQK